ncbi:TonB-dependent receptor [Marinifilum flexuosum]|uniref:Outer membrane receptor protein involved in Fe transport n=1 Tax=Marinifilum flexuosum TaxID=1117708 RepID=A0A419X2S3_9BACT|nr:carboxypeptidase-like regulatory domain-containing protein [Marinifilum flexuosum]RKE02031.1 outer membrane receptor protein involved in Fe transport [Marinifilum flexuosum]
MHPTIYRSIIFFILLIPFYSIAQNTGKITGKVSDTKNNPIKGAHIKIVETNIATSTSSSGNFDLTIDSDKNYTLKVTHVSFQDYELPIRLKKSENKVLNIKLKIKEQEISEVTVETDKIIRDKNISIDKKHLKQIPVSSSGAVEQIIKTLPGVNSNNELSSQYSVRGGNFDENLVYINEIEIYRPNLIRSGQQEGLSVINPDLVSSVQFSSGGFDTKYGDKLSSVLDIKYKTPTKFEASAELSLMGASTHFANASKNGKLSYMAGLRYKTNRYLLNSLDTKGEYEPNYTDFQALVNYKFNSAFSMHIWTSFSQNKYNFEPENRSTSFGTISDALNLDIYFDGNEKDEFNSNIQAVTFKYHPNSNSFIRLIGSRYESIEEEKYDIMGQYYLSDLFVSQGGSQSESVENLGIGTFIDHARNKLDQEVYNMDIKGDHSFDDLFLQWGVGVKKEDISNRINEWQYQDSAGYSVPVSDSKVLLAYNRNANNKISSKHYKSFVQATQMLETKNGELQLTGGLRYHYWDYNKKGYFSPRGSIHYIPNWKNKVKFKLAAGLYQQIPSYREMLMIDGNISPKVNIQKAIHYVLGQEYYFKAWNRPFKFSSELYYKDLLSVTPYDIENVRIRYYGDQEAEGYTTGLDLRINGEFVPGTESWASLSIMKSEENIKGDEMSFIPRPTDQRFNFSMFFQDYLPNNPSYKMHLALFYAGKLPVWTPKRGKDGGSFRMPNYRRIDLGFSKVLVDEKSKNKGLLRHFKSMWIGLEVFNVLDINNTVSYLWINDISGNQYAIPNYLTGRKLNVKLSAKF